MNPLGPGAKDTHDLIVVGAGPAGSAAARTAAALGLRVALVDKQAFPRDKLCGGGLTGRAVKHLTRIFENPALNVPFIARSDIHFHAFGADLGQDANAPALHFIMRHDFDAWLVQEAIAKGADDLTGQAGFLEQSADDGVTCRLPDRTLRAPIAIAADGVNSPTAKHLFGAAFDRSEIGFALEVECTDQFDKPLRIDFGAADWGYGWQFPKTCGTTVGVGGVLSRNADMKGALATYLARLGIRDAPAPKGQFLPFGAFRKTPGRARILLAGDAAGLVDPITGEGIAHALDSGAKAALAAHRALERHAPLSALPTYMLDLWDIHTGLRQARLLRNIMFRPALRPGFIRSFRQSRHLRSEYLALMAGETEYGPLMRKTLARLPKFAMRSLTKE